MRPSQSRGSYMGRSDTWLLAQRGRPERLILIRHGESWANVVRSITQKVPDNYVHLTPKGRRQALDAGKRLKSIIGDESVRFIVSPYNRAKETYNGIAQAFGGPGVQSLIEEPRLREIEFGNYDREDIKELHKAKEEFGPFFYRFPEGESPADVYDRASAFLETLYRMWAQVSEDNYVVISHSTMLLIFIQRFYGMTIDEYYTFESLEHCEFLVLLKNEENWYEQVWSMRADKPNESGIRRRTSKRTQPDIWDGSLESLNDIHDEELPYANYLPITSR